MAIDYDVLSKPELEAILLKLRAELEDLEETITFYFSNSAAHINGGEVLRDEETLEELKSEIAMVEGLISRME